MLLVWEIFTGFYCSQEEKFSTFVPTLLSSRWNGVRILLSSKMASRWTSSAFRNHQCIRSRCHVFLLLLVWFQTWAQAVYLVEEAHYSNTVDAVFNSNGSFYTQSVSQKLQLPANIFVGAFDSKCFLLVSFWGLLLEGLYNEKEDKLNK